MQRRKERLSLVFTVKHILLESLNVDAGCGNTNAT